MKIIASEEIAFKDEGKVCKVCWQVPKMLEFQLFNGGFSNIDQVQLMLSNMQQEDILCPGGQG